MLLAELVEYIDSWKYCNLYEKGEWGESVTVVYNFIKRSIIEEADTIELNMRGFERKKDNLITATFVINRNDSPEVLTFVRLHMQKLRLILERDAMIRQIIEVIIDTDEKIVIRFKDAIKD